MSKLFRVNAEYFIKANNITEAEDYVKEEAGLDYFERHIIVDSIDDITQEIDIDLT